MLDAAAVSAAAAPAAEAATPAHILVIADHIPDHMQLAEAAGPGTAIVTYDASTTSLDHLAAAIQEAAKGGPVQSIAFAQDGAAGTFNLTATEAVNSGSLGGANMVAFWHSIASVLVPNGGIDILACNVAANEAGESVLAQLHSIVNDQGTHISIAASTDTTGGQGVNGNWILEYNSQADTAPFRNVGEIYFNPTELAAWNHSLATGGIIVTPSSNFMFTTEGGGTTTFTVVLASAPTANVVIPLFSSDTTEGTVAFSFLTFTTANWNAAQTVTVTGVNDAAVDGEIAYSVVLGNATSSDTNYAGLNANDVGLINIDNDSKHIVVLTRSDMIVNESGTTTTFRVVLSAAPTANVTIGITSNDTSEGTVSASSLTFTTANWNVAQTVTVTGVNDTTVDGNLPFKIVLAAATSTDAGYAGQNPADISILNIDNDAARHFIFSDNIDYLYTTENGTTATFTVALSRAPTANVTVGLNSIDQSVGTISTNSLLFTTANWSTPQTVTITGVDDTVLEGTAIGYIQGSTAVSTDANWNGVKLTDIMFRNIDNDTSTISIISKPIMMAKEGATVDTFQVVLGKAPTSNVTIALTQSTGLFTLSSTSLTFTAANWMVPQTVTTTAIDNAILGDSTQITITATASSSDGSFNGLSATARAIHIDNDAPGAVLVGGNNLTTENSDTEVSYLWLQKPLTGSQTVTVSIASSNTTEGTVLFNTYTIRAGNSNDGIPVYAIGANDATVDLSISYNISTAVTSTTGGGASGYSTSTAMPTLTLNNTDNDTVIRAYTARYNQNIYGDLTIAGNTISTSVTQPPSGSDNQPVMYLDVDSDATTFNSSSSTLSLPVGATVLWAGLYWGGDLGKYDGTPPPTPSAFNTVKLKAGSGAYTTITASQMDSVDPGYTVTPFQGFADITSFVQANGAASYTVANIQTVTGSALNMGGFGGWSMYVAYSAPGAEQRNVVVYDGFALMGQSYVPVLNIPVSGFQTPISGTIDAKIAVTGYEGDSTIKNDRFMVNNQSVYDAANEKNNFFDSVISSMGDTSSPVRNPSYTNQIGFDMKMIDISNYFGANQTSTNLSFLSTQDNFYTGPVAFSILQRSVDLQVSGTTVTTEAGGTAFFNLRLTSAPTANVTISFQSNDLTEGSLSTNSVTFTPSDWNTVQTVTVTGVDDSIIDGNIGYQVTFNPSVSTDLAYNGITLNPFGLTNNDNDTAGFIITPTSGLVTTEAGGTTTFTVRLTAQPTANVSLGLTSSDTTEGTISTTNLNFNSSNWNVDQTVTITGVNDLVADGNIAYSVITGTSSSSDANFNGLNPVDVSVTNTDNDTVGVIVTPTSGLTTTEVGGTATFTVVLNSQPTANVTIGLTSSDTTEGTVSPASVTFTTSNWNAPQTVMVTGANDLIVDGNQIYTIITAAATSADALYNGYNASDVTVTNTDNDVAGFFISPSAGLNTTEMGGTASFNVRLTAQPTSNVVIAISSSNTAEGTVSVSSLTFTSANWNSDQSVTVTGVDDLIDDGNVAYSVVTGAAVSADAAFNGLNPLDVGVLNQDNDTGGFIISPTGGLTTTEAGGTATFTVRLATQPTGNVVLGLSSSNTAEGTVSPASLTFTAANWNVNQTVTITGVNDFVDDGNIAYSIITGAAVSTDTFYNGINPTDITATNTDNDTVGITVTPTSGLTTTEAGGTATFTVVLNSQPTANVVIGLTSNDLTEGTVGPASLTFTSANWNVAQTVTITGVDDLIIDGNQAYTIVTAAAVSADLLYNNINASDVSVTNTDNDAYGFIITPVSGLTTTEAGGTATFTVRLTSAPTANVTLGLTSNDLTEGTISASSLTFTTLNWNVNQTVTITGVNDFVADGNIPYSIITASATSTDANYNGINPTDISVSNTDNDTVGIIVTPTSGLTTTEAGSTATFTVTLNSQPTANVVIGLTSSDTTEGTVGASSLTFTAANWNVAQTVTVTGVNDFFVDGNQSYTIVTAAATSSDALYNGFNASDVSVTNTDNDTVGINVVGSPITTTEAGGTATFTVTLNSQPTANVVVGISSSNTAEGTVSVSSLTFTAANWNVAQTVTVTGVDDFVDDGNIAYTIITAAATSADGLYNGFNAVDVAATNTDNDTVGITVTPTSGLTTTEAGGATTFTVVLNSQPTANVVIGLSSSDTTEGTVGPGSLTFTAANWNVAQTVTVAGVDDFIIDGNQAYTIITAPVSSADALYNNLNAADVSVTTTDNDTAGFIITPINGLTTTEAGGTATFTVRLTAQPNANVTIGLSSSNTAEGTVGPSSLTFTSANWNVNQTVTITGVNDFVQDGNQLYSIITGTAVSTDTNFNGLNPTDVTVTNTDNDTVGINVVGSPITTTEAGGTATFTVTLNSQPTANVIVGISSSNTAEGTVSVSSLTFTAANWNVAQTITVTGINDFVDDGDITYSIITAPATSADVLYNGLNAADVSATNTDNDTVGITVTPTSGLTTTEAGGATTFTVVLNSQPTANVTIGLTSSDTTEGTVGPGSLTFTAANWNVAQTVTVTGVDDFIIDGNQAYTIITAPASSADALYNNLNVADVSVTTTDNDTAGFIITPVSGLTTTEAGGTATFTVRLTAQPNANVTIGLSSSNTAEGTVAPSSLIFNAANWNIDQTVTVTGVNDFVQDGNQLYSIITGTAVSTDTNFNGLNPTDISVTNTDNDLVGITVTPTSGLTTTEAGGTATFTVVLNSQPTADVTIALTSNDATEGTVSTNSLTFTAANWNVAQTVTVTGVDDFVQDGNISYTIVTAAATSTDVLYNGYNAADISATNTDNDTVGVIVTPTSGLTTTEAGGNTTFTVRLNSQPTADVTIGILTNDATEGTASVTNLTFTAANWNVNQTVTVTGVDDFVVDGNQAYSIITAPTTSADTLYNGLNANDVTLTNTDNDTIGINVVGGPITTTEAGGTATFTITLNSQPTADVTIAISSSDTTEGTVSTSSLTFTAANWNVAQTVTVTGADDFVQDGNITYTIVTGAATSADGLYNGYNAADVNATNIDNDTVGIIVTPTSGLTTTEAGGNATFTVRLNSQPTADVTIGILTNDATEGTASVTNLTFTAANWNVNQTVTVTGVDDFVVDGNQVYSIITAPATSADTLYNGLNANDVTLTNTDNDTVGINVVGGPITTTEAGGTATFTITLNSQPTADVTIAISSSDTTEGTVSTNSLTFTAANWNVAQTVTVTGADDFVQDGNITYTIVTGAATSADGLYNGYNAADVSATNTDNDTVGVIVTPTSGLTTTEAGGNATFTVRLNSQPTADVTIGILTNDATEGTASVTNLTFTAANWNVNQTVTVTGVDDFVVDGNQVYSIITAPATSADTLYNGLNANDVTLTNTDNDTIGINVVGGPLTTTEAGGTATFTITLNSQPTADVTIAISSSDTTEGTVSTNSLTFTAANWNVAQTVTVTGADDFVQDGNITYTIVTGTATSADALYNGYNAADISATNTDNDTVGIIVTPTNGLTTTEAGGSDTFTVRLNSQPTSDVTISILSNDLTEGTASITSLTFTAANWNINQTVTVTGVNDFVVDGNQNYTIITGAATSADVLYNGLNATDVSLTNTDNDTVGIIVTPTSGLTTTEAGGNTTFTVRLNSQPTADVTIGILTNDATEGTANVTSLTFTAANWNINQTVTVTGVDDFVVDGNQAYSIITAPATSADSLYNGLNANDVSLTNTDNDTIGINVVGGPLTTTEAGGTATFTITLNSQPTADVTIAISSSDTTEGTVSTNSLTFTAANWNVAQTVTVTGADDFVQDGNITYTIVTGTATSADALYNGYNAADISATNTDNDTVGIIVTPANGLTTTEAGGSDTFTVRLNSQPTSDVTISILSNDLTEGTASVTSLTFTVANWNIDQTVTVTGIDDFVVDGNQTYSIITAPATSADSLYNGLNANDVTLTNTDNDTIGINVVGGPLTTTEAGGTATFTITLNSQPTADVTIAISSSDTTEGTVSTNSLTFTAANWNVAQTVTVTGADDFVQDGNITYTIVTGAATSADALYNGYNAADVSATNTDNDTVGIIVTPTSGLTTTEAESSDTFTVRLNSQPTADVTISILSNDATEGTASVTSLTFTAANWNIDQTVTVTGVDDFVVDGNQTYSIITAPATSADSLYNGLNANDVTLTNTDNDTIGINVVGGPITTTEAGGTATFTVTLNSQPTADVTIAVTSNDTTEGTVSTNTLTFTAANWNVAQTVTVTGTDDFVQDGNISYTIVTGAAASADALYNGYNAADVSATNTDNDTVGIIVTPTNGLTTTEAGGADTFTVRLNSQPTADVTISILSNDATEGTASVTNLTFTATNWNIDQTVTVTGVDDFVVDGNQAYSIITAPATSADSLYNGLNANDVTLTNTDNDTIGINVVGGPLTTTEAGGTATFTITLNSQPTADVTIAISSSDTTEGTVSTNSLTFTAANWNVAQTVTVTGADDFVQDGNITYTIVTGTATSADALYNGYNAADVSATNTDNDTVGIIVTPTSGLTTTEAGGSDTFTVRLNSQPTSDVTISILSNDATEGTANVTSLTFTVANWNIDQTVTVTGVDDFVVDGNQAYSIITAPATSADSLYNGLNTNDVTLTNTDNDTIGINVVGGPLTTTEAGGTATFTITLNSQPTADVTIAISSNDTTEGTVSTNSLTFTAANWNVAQTVIVTGADDFVQDGNITYTIVTGTATSADALYNGYNAADVSATNTDNDTVGIIVTPTTGLITTEAGGSDTFTVRLNSQPTSDVTISILSNDATEGTASVTSLTFTAANWNIDQTVTVTGVDDFVVDGNQAYSIITAPATSADALYNGLNANDVTLTNTDNDTIGINVVGGPLTTTEAGGTATFTITLNSQPTADVTIAISSSDTTEGTVSTNSLTFTAANWNVAQTVTVTGADDFVQDGNVTYTIVTGTATSADVLYNGYNAADVSATNTDNDTVGIIVTPTTGLTTTEAGGSDTFTIRLNSQPTSDVTISILSNDATEGTASVTSLTFTAANWNIDQNVTVTGVDDFVVDGNQTYSIITAPATSADVLYNGLNASDVSLTNTDNDTVGIIVTPTSGLTTTEAGGNATFTVRLNSQPTADVTIGILTNDATEGAANVTTLTFTAANWNVDQTVTVSGVDDFVVDGNQAYSIITAPAISTDTLYNGLNANDVTLTNTDNDTIGINVVGGPLTTTEAGGTATFTITLNSQPTADVTIAISSNDTTEGTVSTNSLTFTAANWNVAQTVTVTGADDFVQDGNITYTIVTGAATSADALYNGYNAADVSATNTDNDTVGIIVTPTSGLTTTEAGGSDTFTVRLNSQPTAEVTISILSNDTTEGTASVTSLTFTAANWNIDQTVTVTGVDDFVVDGNQAYSIITAPATSADSLYNGLNANDVTLTNTDNDTIGINVVGGPLTTTEAGGTATFTITLNSQPTADVTIAISSNDTTEGTVSTSSLTFTAANWNVAQTVTVTGADDFVQDGNITYTIVTGAATTADVLYNGYNAADVSATNTDNDTVGIIVTPTSGLTTTEAGGNATFTVRLNSQPTADVTIGILTNDATEGTASVISLIFTAANWNVDQTVTATGIDDFVVDGNQAYSIITAPAISSDALYNGLNANDVSLTNTDNDTIGINVVGGPLTTTEAGGSSTFTITLNSQPTADVTIAISSSDTTEGTVSTNSLTFTAANWNVAQTVTVTGADDFVQDGNISYTIVTGAATSADALYNGYNAADVSATNTDNDTVGIIVTPTNGLTTTEAGGNATFTVRLNSQPTADVTIGILTNDVTEGSASVTTLTFTAANWNIDQTVTVTGIDDFVVDGNQAYSIITGPATSTDTLYNGLDANDVSLTNTDNDTIGINVVGGPLTTTEAGGTSTFTITLNSQPTADVTVAISSSDPTEGTVSTNSLTFTAANWNIAQNVTVTGTDDFVQDGNITYTIVTGAATSADVLYNGYNAADVSATNTDNDTVGIIVTPTSGLTTTEAGGSDTFTVRLNSQPTSDVTISILTNDASEGTASVTSLTFTAANWNIDQTVTVTGIDDFVVDGNQAYSIITGPATSSDVLYNGLNASDITFTNTDNDSIGINVVGSALTTTEAGGTATFTITLNSQPTADVTVALNSSDTTEGTLSTNSLTFMAANWNIAQTITVSGVDDFVQDGNISYTIITAAATSADALYNGYDAADVSVTNADNDTVGIIVTPVSGLTTSEAGGTATFSVVLNSQPTSIVGISIITSNPTEGTANTSGLLFTPGNWNIPVLVTVTGVNDFVVDGDQAYTIITGAASSVDALYNNLNATDVSVTNTDNDTVGINVVAGPLTTTEAGGTGTFTVTLNSQPTADVTVAISSSDTTEGTVSTNSLTFTAANWNIAQTVTVTGADDFVQDGNITYTIITAPAASADALYNGYDAADVNATNTDNDTAGIIVIPTTGLVTSEGGGTTTFTVRLNSQPTDDVTIGIITSDATEGIPNITNLTFTAANWNVNQTVTVTGVDDFVVDGDQSYNIITALATSTDALYNGMDGSDVSVTNTDNDTVGINVVGGPLTTSEGGSTGTFTITLNSQPTSDVTIAINSSNTAEGTVSTNSLTFTAADWNIAQTVTVTGIDDATQDGNITYTIATAPAVSTDVAYNGYNAIDITATNLDDDTAGIYISPISGLTTTEAGGAATFAVRLTSQPTADVTIGMTTSNAAEGTITITTLTFTASNWNIDQTVTVTGIDDFVQDGNQPYTIITAAAVSADVAYNGLNTSDVSLTNTDNDSVGIILTATGGLTTTEAGGIATYTARLNSQPTSDVTITITSSDPTEGIVNVGSITFTSANWNIDQTITITGVDDLVVDGNQAYTIITAPAISADPLYAGVDPVDISVTNIDNDSIGVIVTPTTGLVTSENGGSATFTVSLNSQPTSDVTITLNTTDLTEGTPSTTTLVFTAGNWNITQTVTVTGINDFIVDGDKTYLIVTAPAFSLDPLYNNFDAPDISLTNTDTTVPITPPNPTPTQAPLYAAAPLLLPYEFGYGAFLPPETEPFHFQSEHSFQLDGSDRTPNTFGILNSIPSEILLASTEDLVIDSTSDMATLMISLSVPPVSDVLIHFDINDPLVRDLNPGILTFDSENWSTPQKIYIKPSDIPVMTDHLITIDVYSTSSDVKFHGLLKTQVSVLRKADHTAHIPQSDKTGMWFQDTGIYLDPMMGNLAIIGAEFGMQDLAEHRNNPFTAIIDEWDLNGTDTL